MQQPSSVPLLPTLRRRDLIPTRRWHRERTQSCTELALLRGGHCESFSNHVPRRIRRRSPGTITWKALPNAWATLPQYLRNGTPALCESVSKVLGDYRLLRHHGHGEPRCVMSNRSQGNRSSFGGRGPKRWETVAQVLGNRGPCIGPPFPKYGENLLWHRATVLSDYDPRVA